MASVKRLQTTNTENANVNREVTVCDKLLFTRWTFWTFFFFKVDIIILLWTKNTINCKHVNEVTQLQYQIT